MKQRVLSALATAGIASGALCADAPSSAPAARAAAAQVAAPAHQVAAGEAWRVEAVTSLGSLDIAPGARLEAPAGMTLTLTVDGTERAVAPGHYAGRVVLTPARDIPLVSDDMGGHRTYHLRTAVHVVDGQVVAASSVSAALQAGSESAGKLADARIRSVAPMFNGVLIDGKGRYVLERPDIGLEGNGRNDFKGVGAAIRIGGSGEVEVRGARIRNRGAVRTAVWAGDDATVRLRDCDIDVRDGALPPDYDWSWLTGPKPGGDVMMEIPWMLGARGNNRATLAVGNAHVTYEHCRVHAQAWGAMSTDAVGRVLLDIDDTQVRVDESGYGTYADGNSMVTARRSAFDVPDYGAILSGGSVTLTEGTKVRSRRIGIMAHGGASGRLLIDKGSSVHAREAVLQLKASSPTIVIDGAALVSEHGRILQVMAQDDPNKAGGGSGMPGPGGGMPGPGGPGGPGDPAGPGGPPGAMGSPPAGEFNATDGDDDVDATFRHVQLVGDLLDSDVAHTGMKLRFESAKVRGAIGSATGRHARNADGSPITMKGGSGQYALIGQQEDTPAEVPAGHVLRVALDGASTWTVTRSSWLTELDLAAGATLRPSAGSRLRLRVDGHEVPIAPGRYAGRVALEVVAAGR